MSPFLDSSWVAILVSIGQAILKIYKDFTQDGLYEVLDYESTLELNDRLGKSASFKKAKKFAIYKTISLLTRIRHGEMEKFWLVTVAHQDFPLIGIDLARRFIYLSH